MSDVPWLLQIYEMTDSDAWDSVALTLSSAPAVTAVDKRTCERGTYLAVELSDPDSALLIYELVLMGDPKAELVHSTSNPDEHRPTRKPPAESVSGERDVLSQDDPDSDARPAT